MTASQPALTVVRSDPTRVTEAMSALLSAGPSAAGRFTAQARAAAIRLDLLWCAQDDAGRYRLAVLAVPSPGRTAMLVATRARSRADVDALRDVIAIAARGVADLADIAQALIDPAQSLDIAAFESASFRKMATSTISSVRCREPARWLRHRSRTGGRSNPSPRARCSTEIS